MNAQLSLDRLSHWHRMEDQEIAEKDADLRALVREKLILDCKDPTSDAALCLLDYRVNNDSDISAVEFIALAEKANLDFWDSALNRAQVMDALYGNGVDSE